MIYKAIICNFGLRRVFRLFFRQSLLSFFPESYIMKQLNGRSSDLLPCRRLPASPVARQWQDGLKVLELTAAGTVQEFPGNYRDHLIPFSASLPDREFSTILRTSIEEKNEIAKYKFLTGEKPRRPF
jgi:hypothetical protein